MDECTDIEILSCLLVIDGEQCSSSSKIKLRWSDEMNFRNL